MTGVMREVHALKICAAPVWFLAAASFEPRSVRGATLLSPKSIERSLVFQYEDTLDSAAGAKNTRDLRRSLEIASSLVDVLPCRYQDPGGVVRLLKRWANHNGDPAPAGVVLDVTCFTKLHLVMLLLHLVHTYPQAKLTIMYSEPLGYATDFGKDLSHGVRETLYFPLVAGGGASSERVGLVILLGHEQTRAVRVIEELEPEEIILLVGRHGFSAEMARISERKHRHLLNRARYESFLRVADCSTVDYTEVARTLLRSLEDLGSRSVNTVYVAPLGTKLQALGLVWVALHPPAVALRLAYPMPAYYEKRLYSHGVGRTFVGEPNLSTPIPPVAAA